MTDPTAREATVEIRDAHSTHGEEWIRARYAPEVADRGYGWPATGVTREGFRNQEVIVARLEGVVAGRCILDAVWYPLAELENVEVVPAFRGHGVGSALVREATRRAGAMGFLAIHAQTFHDETGAHRLYARHGYLPATRGEMLRVWRFLNLPALAYFQYEHPFALFDSVPGPDAREHFLRWHDPHTDDELAVMLTGGSCQSDSGGLAPSVSALRLRSGETRLAASVTASADCRAGDDFTLTLRLVNEGAPLEGGFRIGLNPGFRPGGDHPGGERFSLASGNDIERTLAFRIGPDFQADLLCIGSYLSVPVTVDFLLGDHTFWLCTQALLTMK
jgi:GNAT superfamily N-acetyltransferase